jgi:uncharacterized surface protein with fasciclin (FAS1) repeats
MLRTLLAAAAATALLAPIAAMAQDAGGASTAAPVAAAAPMAESPNLTAAGSIAATIKASPHFTILSKALDQAQLSAVLNATPGLTLFAPTDEAFRALPPSQLAKLLAPDNAPILQKVLIYHLVNAKLDGSKIKGAKGDITTVETSKLQLDGSGTPLKVNDADIIQADVIATNGTIHVIDKVLIPGDVKLPSA